MPYDIILIVELRNRQKSNKCECAGIGRQARLRGVCFTTYGFKSRHSHHRKDLIPCVSSLFYFAMQAMTGLEVALRPPPVAEKGSKALSEIRSIRKCVHAQRNATIFQTGRE